MIQNASVKYPKGADATWTREMSLLSREQLTFNFAILCSFVGLAVLGTGAIFGDYFLIDLGGVIVIVAIIVYAVYFMMHARKVKGKKIV